MGIKNRDLVDTILSKISIDEFEPKTGESKDVAVVGFNITEKSAGEDLNTFINTSVHEIRDVEVSPNPNNDGYFMVFVELDRNEHLFNNIVEIVKDVENVAGKLKWKASTHLTSDYLPLEEKSLSKYLITDPEKYMTKQEWEDSVNAEDEIQAPEESVNNNGAIVEFLQSSNLDSAEVNEQIVTMKRLKDQAQLEIVGFGNAQDIMADVGIAESAIGGNDIQLRQFNSMLGKNLNAIKIDEYIVVFNADTKQALIGKPC